jgi:hypothetical protein
MKQSVPARRSAFAKLAFLPAAAVLLMAADVSVGRGTMTFPDNFGPVHETAMSGESMLQAVEGGAPNGPNCVLQSKAVPGGVTATQLDQYFGHTFGVAEWAEFIGSDPATTIVSRSEYRLADGRHRHQATIQFGTPALMTEYAFIIEPSFVVIGSCYANVAGYSESYLDRFDAAVDTLHVTN